jgi:hypothetical protein
VGILATDPQIRSVNSVLVAGAVVSAGSAITNYVTGFSCPVYALTHHYCAACGATRAVLAAVEGDPMMALRNNAIVVLMIVFVAARFVMYTAGPRSVIRTVDDVLVRVNIRFWATIVVGWTIARNLPWLPMLGPPR